MKKKVKKELRRKMKKSMKRLRYDMIATVDRDFKGPFTGLDAFK